MAIPDPIPVNPRIRNNPGRERRNQNQRVNRRPVRNHQEHDGLAGIPVPVRVLIIVIVGIMLLKNYADREIRVARRGITEARTISQTTNKNIYYKDKGFSYLLLRSYPAGSVQLDKKTINTPTRYYVKVKEGQRTLKFISANPKLRNVAVPFKFKNKGYYEVLVNFKKGTYYLKTK